MAHAPDDIIAFGWDDWCLWSDYAGDREGEDYSIIKHDTPHWHQLMEQ